MRKTGNERQLRQVGVSGWRVFAEQHRQVFEVCWCGLALVLFMVLGPFAAPVAVFALLNLPSEERGEAEPEMLSETVGYQLR
jgi:hypothetical protein